MSKEKYYIACENYKDWAYTMRDAKIKALQEMLCAQTDNRFDVDLVASIENERTNEVVYLSFADMLL